MKIKPINKDNDTKSQAAKTLSTLKWLQSFIKKTPKR